MLVLEWHLMKDEHKIEYIEKQKKSVAPTPYSLLWSGT
jgi:hypothetical protein